MTFERVFLIAYISCSVLTFTLSAVGISRLRRVNPQFAGLVPVLFQDLVISALLRPWSVFKMVYQGVSIALAARRLRDSGEVESVPAGVQQLSEKEVLRATNHCCCECEGCRVAHAEKRVS